MGTTPAIYERPFRVATTNANLADGASFQTDIFDLLGWSHARIFTFSNKALTVTISCSRDGTNFRSQTVFSPAASTSLNELVPRTARYMRVAITHSAGSATTTFEHSIEASQS